MILISVPIGLAAQDQRTQQRTKDPYLALADSAMGVPPELGADILIRLAESSQVTNKTTKIEWLERAFDMAKAAKFKLRDVANGYAGLWWRVDGDHGEQLALDNSFARLIDERPVSGSAVGRGATGSSGWKWYSIELPVAMGAKDIAFGLLLTGTGTAWFDSLAVELNDTPYTNPQFDFDFESPTPKGFPFTGDNRRRGRYRVGLDSTVAMTGRQSLKMQFIGDPAQPDSAPVHTPTLPVLNPVVIDHSKSLEYSTPVVITFSNRSSTAVDIYWIDYSGVRKLKKSSLAVGESWRTSTFVTHPWLVVASGTGGAEQRDTGLRLAGFQASDSGGEAVVTDRK